MDTSQIIPAAVSIGGVGAVLGAVLAYASKVFYVKVDPKVTEINEILPQANCGACGYPGCTGYAEAVAALKAEVHLCTPGGQEVIDKIAAIMGVEATSAEPMVAYCACNGTKENAKDRFEYYGIKECSSATFISGGHKQCEYGCLGFGDCVDACNFDAIYIDEKTGLPVVIDDKCTGCRACVDACPKDIMKMMPKSADVYLACNSKAKGKEVMDACKVGCIGCKICALPKTTPTGSIKMEGDLPVVSYDNKEEDFSGARQKCPKVCFIDKADPNDVELNKFKEEEKKKKAEAKKKALELAAKKKAEKAEA